MEVCEHTRTHSYSHILTRVGLAPCRTCTLIIAQSKASDNQRFIYLQKGDSRVDQCFSNFNVQLNPLGILLACRLWFIKPGGTQDSAFLTGYWSTLLIHSPVHY